MGPSTPRPTSGSRRILRRRVSSSFAASPGQSTLRRWIRRSCMTCAPALWSDQALGAIHDHAQNTVEPTEEQLALIAEFQRTDKRFFSSDALEDFARGGPPPELPPGQDEVAAARPPHVRRDRVHSRLHQGHLRPVPHRSNAQSDQPFQPHRPLPGRASRTSGSVSGTS